MKSQEKKQKTLCSFCSKPEEEVGLLLGENTKICHMCALKIADRFDQLMEEEFIENGLEDIRNCPKPCDIKNELDCFVIGQESAKISLAVAFYNHHLRQTNTEMNKSNVLVVGPTGVGKTLSLRILSTLFNIPFLTVDAKRFTEAGYHGDDVENMIFELFQISGQNIPLTENGVIYIDEIDKIKKMSDGTRDISGEGVQNALLKIIEGCIVSIPTDEKNKNQARKFVDIDTANILFVFGGAFVGLEDIVAKNSPEGKLQKIGFGADSSFEEKKKKRFELLQQAKAKDFIEYGLIPEFIGRVSKIVPFNDLDENDLRKILTEPHNSIVSEFQKLFAMHDIELIFEELALQEIARLAIQSNVGARGLRNAIEKILELLMYNLFSQTNPPKICRINKNFILAKGHFF